MTENQQNQGFEGQNLSQGADFARGGQAQANGGTWQQSNGFTGGNPGFQGQSFQQQPNFYQKAKKPVNRALRITLASLGALLVGLAGGLLWGSSWGRNSANQQIYPKIQSTKEDVLQRNSIEEYWAGADSEMNWDFESFEELDFSSYENPEGSLVEDLIDQHGRATEVEVDGNSLRLTWRDLESSETLKPTVTATFEKEGVDYRLEGLTAERLMIEGSKHSSSRDYMTDDYFKQLKVGEEGTGKGGTSYRDVLMEYSNTSSLYIRQSYDGDNDRAVMRLSYYANDRNYFLEFTQQDDKNFLLSKAERK